MNFSETKWPGFQAFSNRVLSFVLVWAVCCSLERMQSAAEAGGALLVMLVWAVASACGVRSKGWRGLGMMFLFTLVLLVSYRAVLGVFGIQY